MLNIYFYNVPKEESKSSYLIYYVYVAVTHFYNFIFEKKLSIEEIHQIMNSDAEDIFDESDSDEDFVPIAENETDDSNTSSSESEVDVVFGGSNATEEGNFPNILSKDKSIIWHDQPLPIQEAKFLEIKFYVKVLAHQRVLFIWSQI